MINTPNQNEEGDYIYPSSMVVGEQVRLKIPDNNIDTEKAYIRAIIFTNMKVRFSIFLEGSDTTIHNVDSVWVEKLYSPNMMDFGEDNYS